MDKFIPGDWNPDHLHDEPNGGYFYRFVHQYGGHEAVVQSVGTPAHRHTVEIRELYRDDDGEVVGTSLKATEGVRVDDPHDDTLQRLVRQEIWTRMVQHMEHYSE